MSFSPLRVKEMVRKELRQLLRDPKTKRITFAAPIIQLVLLGYAVTTDVEDLSTVVVDHDQTSESRLLLETITSSGYFRIVSRYDRPQALQEALDAGRARVSVEIPRGFAQGLEGRGGAEIQVLIDGTSSNTATVAQGYMERIVRDFSADRAREHGMELQGGIQVRTRAWYNPDLSSQVYNVPAIVGILLMLMALLLTALAVVRERELGTLEQLMVSPISPRELILGKTVPVVIICLMDLALITVVAMLWFDVPFRGSVFVLLMAALVYILAGLGFGLLISTISRTQQEAFLTMFLFFLPALILSGFMYPIESMPKIFQDLTLANPIRYFMEMVRGIFLKGLGIRDLWIHYLVLGGMTVLALGAAALRFNKRLE